MSRKDNIESDLREVFGRKKSHNQTLFQIAVILLLIFLVSIYTIFYEEPTFEKDQVKQFASCDELNSFVKASSEIYSGYFGGAEIGAMRAQVLTETGAEQATEPSAKSEDYSTTNIQVEGVDEADIVKNDGKYIYAVSGKNIVIIDAYPAENAETLSEIELGGTPREIYVNSDKLVVFGDDSSYGGYGEYYYRGYYSQNTFIKVYDVSDRKNPVLKRDLSVNGSYFDSRMIGDYVYVIVNQPIYVMDEIPIPMISSGSEVKSVCGCSDVYYFDVPDYTRRFTTIMSVNTQNDDEEASGEVFVMGTTQNIYVSLNNIYVTYMKRFSYYDFMDRIIDEAVMPFVSADIRERINNIRSYEISSASKWQEISNVLQEYSESLSMEERTNLMKQVEEKMKKIYEDIAKEMEKTVIHKISIDNGNIEYKVQGYAPGNVLNQFSMDEYNGYFRIATTTGQSWVGGTRVESKNHVYVLDSELNIVGRLEDLASGERIYSARFIGNKAYMVTFRQIDPLFIIDLENPNNPKVLGYLKIPGVSDYLHPYDETHIIGVGIDATEEGRMLGMKLSLFDVSDVQNPTEISKYIIGERGTSSEALNDHKAFLFSRAKNLLIIPVNLVEGGKYNAFQGDYVFNLDLDNGFVLKGTVTHRNQTAEETYYYDYGSQIRRSLYIDDVLYTISQKMVKMNSLEDLEEINKVNLPYEEEVYPYPLIERTE